MSLQQNTVVAEHEAHARHVSRKQWVACGEAFLDCRIPGSQGKINYALVGMVARPLRTAHALTLFRQSAPRCRARA